MASALGVPHPASRTTKEETKMMRDIAISDRRRCIRLGCASFTGQGRLPYSRRQSRGLSCLYYAYCESWRTGLEPFLGTCASIASNQPFLIPFGQASSKAIAVAPTVTAEALARRPSRAGAPCPRVWVILYEVSGNM